MPCSQTMPCSYTPARSSEYSPGKVAIPTSGLLRAGMTGMLQKLVSSRRVSGQGTQDLSWASTSGPQDRNWQALRGFQTAEGASLLWNQPDRPPDIPNRASSQTSSGGYEHLEPTLRCHSFFQGASGCQYLGKCQTSSCKNVADVGDEQMIECRSPRISDKNEAHSPVRHRSEGEDIQTGETAVGGKASPIRPRSRGRSEGTEGSMLR